MNRIIDFFTSLKLTVVCLCAAVVLVFVGTMAQVDQGLYAAQNRFFRSVLVYWSPPGFHRSIPVFPGGYLLGAVLLVNLFATHLSRFSFNRRNIGSWLTHTGIMLLLVGQFATDLLQRESYLRLTEGESKNYSESGSEDELAVINTTPRDYDEVVAIPATRLANEHSFQNSKWPFTLQVRQYLPNSRLERRAPMVDKDPAPASEGIGQSLKVTPLPSSTKMDERNLPTAIVEVKTPQGTLGTWLVSSMLMEKQSFQVGNQTYQLEMRFKRFYKPYAIQLQKFRHDKYKGTDIPKNFSSRVRLRNPETGEDREVLIYMNNPLRYGGETYYQASFDKNDPRVTVLQVVRNPSWLTPYISCLMVGAGLLIQFMSHLTYFVAERRAA